MIHIHPLKASPLRYADYKRNIKNIAMDNFIMFIDDRVLRGLTRSFNKLGSVASPAAGSQALMRPSSPRGIRVPAAAAKVSSASTHRNQGNHRAPPA